MFSVLMNVAESSTGNNPNQKIISPRQKWTEPTQMTSRNSRCFFGHELYHQISNEFSNEASRKSRKNRHTHNRTWFKAFDAGFGDVR